jgi:hypothetical protein
LPRPPWPPWPRCSPLRRRGRCHPSRCQRFRRQYHITNAIAKRNDVHCQVPAAANDVVEQVVHPCWRSRPAPSVLCLTAPCDGLLSDSHHVSACGKRIFRPAAKAPARRGLQAPNNLTRPTLVYTDACAHWACACVVPTVGTSRGCTLQLPIIGELFELSVRGIWNVLNLVYSIEILHVVLNLVSSQGLVPGYTAMYTAVFPGRRC